MELVEAGKKIEGLQKMIHEQLDLEQGRRNFILSLVAAVYLPLSFVTSLFGMNIAVTTPEGLVGFSDFTNSTLAGLSADFLNSTRALVSSIETSGPLTWNWKTFGIITGPLLLTMPLSLLALGVIFRLAVRSAAFYSTYWRILAIIVTATVFCISVFWQYMSVYMLIPGYLFTAGLLLLGLVQLYRRRRKGDQLFWVIFLMLMVSSSLVAFLSYYFPFLIFPWAWLAWPWVGPWLKRRKDDKSRLN